MTAPGKRKPCMSNLTNLASAIAASDALLSRAERQGMEVSQAKLQETQARDALLKARVAVHAFRDSELKKDTDAGLRVDKTDARGWGEGDAGMEIPARRAGAIARGYRAHPGGAGTLYQETWNRSEGPHSAIHLVSWAASGVSPEPR